MIKPWTCWKEFMLGDVWFGIWRSDRGCWGYSNSWYDGEWKSFGLGRLMHACWGNNGMNEHWDEEFEATCFPFLRLKK